MDEQTIYQLIRKYKNGVASDAEIKALTEFYRSRAYRPEFGIPGEFPEEETAVEQAMFDRLMKQTQPPVKKRSSWIWQAAASVLVIIGVSGIYLLTKESNRPVSRPATAMINDVAPGGDKATLTLSDGSKVPLTVSVKGEIAGQGSIKITKTAAGQVVYSISAPLASQGKESGRDLGYNTIETPVGGQFQVILADGTKVWLNAMSSLRFPVNFSGRNERMVELAGEGYFEVSHDRAKPFRVRTADETVEVFGTHFNVAAYPDGAATRTTLLEGSVGIVSGKNSVLLKPGQQADLQNGFRVSAVNTEEVVAWKNGYFSFDDERLEVIMKAVSKWYGVKVIFEDESLKNERIGLLSTRFSNISGLLKIILQAGGSDFRIEGSTVHLYRKK